LSRLGYPETKEKVRLLLELLLVGFRHHSVLPCRRALATAPVVAPQMASQINDDLD